jgi:hypothetical protein
MHKLKKPNLAPLFLYTILFLIGIKALFHGFPDIERFFAEWMDERISLTTIIKFGTLNFAPTQIFHPPLYHYLTFIPIAIFFIIGKLIGFFHDKIDFVRFYFNNTHYFFLIGRAMGYIFYWTTAIVIFKLIRLFYSNIVAHITVLSYLLIPRFIFDFSTTRPETLLFLNVSVFFYFFLRYYLNNQKIKYLFLSSFFLGIAIATKYNALYLASIFVFLFVIQIINKTATFRQFLTVFGSACCFVFLGFFISNPFFIIKFNTYLHNLLVFSTDEIKYYWAGYYPVVFCITHIKDLMSLMYLNFFGFLILIFGAWRLFKKDKNLFFIIIATVFVYEAYFSIFHREAFPLRYLHPLLPIVALIFSAGIDFIIRYKKKLMAILAIFFGILIYNYFDIWKGLSIGKTYIQEARSFIESTIPEFTTICIASNHYLPQLNMTRESYSRLMETAPLPRGTHIQAYKLSYKPMDNEDNYDASFRELRIESLTKKPQYDIIRWNNEIKTENDASAFIKDNNIKYLVSAGACLIGNKKIEDTKVAFLLKEFEPKNKRVFEGPPVFLYKVIQ